MSRAIGVFAGLALSASAGAAEYAWQWPLTLDPDDQPAYLVALGDEVLAALHDPLLRDIEVLDASGRRMPSAMQSALPVAGATLETVPLRGFHLDSDELPASDQLRARLSTAEVVVELHAPPTPGPTTQLLLDLGDIHASIEALQLSPQRIDAEPWLASLRVETSRDLQAWRVLQPRFDAYRLEQGGQTLSALRLPLPAAPSRYLRLTWLPGKRQGALAGVLGEHRRVEGEAAVPLRWLALEGSLDADGSWVYRTPGPLLVERWRLRPDAERWLGNAILDSRAQAEAAWQARAQLASYRFELDGVWLDDGDHVLAPSRDREWRLRWRNEAGGAPQLMLAYRVDHLLFMAEGQAPYRLVAGSSTARRIDAPTTAALAAARAQRGAGWLPGSARTGQRAELAGAAALQPPIDGERWQRGLLWAILLAAAASVLVMALRLIRGAGSPP